MRASLPPEDDSGLPPPGQRWGAGAQSVLPYLTKTLQARPVEAAQGREALRDPEEWRTQAPGAHEH